MQKFTEIEKGTFIRTGTEYNYVIEAAEEVKDKQSDIRLRIIEEKPVIKKIRTRYDPEITMYGDKGASMELLLGYDMNEINRAFQRLMIILLIPVYGAGIGFGFTYLYGTSKELMPFWVKVLLYCITIVLSVVFLRFYYKHGMMFLAEYLKARKLKGVLEKEGFRDENK